MNSDIITNVYAQCVYFSYHHAYISQDHLVLCYPRNTFGRRTFSVAGRRPGMHCQTISTIRCTVSATSGKC